MEADVKSCLSELVHDIAHASALVTEDEVVIHCVHAVVPGRATRGVHGEEVGAADVTRELDVNTSLQRRSRGGGTACAEDHGTAAGLEDSLGPSPPARSAQRDAERASDLPGRPGSRHHVDVM